MSSKQLYKILIVVALLAVTSYAQDANTNDDETIRGFLPRWSKGDTWGLKIYASAKESSIPRWELMEIAQMSVVETPSKDTNDCFVISYFGNKTEECFGEKTKDCAFFFLNVNDLSLQQYRTAIIEGFNGKELEQKLSDWENAKPQVLDKKDNAPVGVLHGWARLVFPVLKQEDKLTNAEKVAKYSKQSSAQAMEIERIDGQPALIVYYVRGNGGGDKYWERLKTGRHNRVLVWQKGDSWWTSTTVLDWQGNGVFRMELLKTYEDLKGKDTAGKFNVLYNRWKQAEVKNKTIEEREYYYRMLNLGKDATPLMVEKLKAGDEKIIKAISELTGVVPQNATKSRCIEWWENVEAYKKNTSAVKDANSPRN